MSRSKVLDTWRIGDHPKRTSAGEPELMSLGNLFMAHRVLEQEGGLTNYTKRSDTVRVAGATPLTTPMFRQITEFRFFEKINFLIFWVPR